MNRPALAQSLAARKQEVSVKVKEIKQRQHNWMKQRAAAGKETEAAIDDDLGKCSYRLKAEPKPPQKESSVQSGTDSKVLNLITSKKSKAKFHNWLKAKDNTELETTNETIPNVNKHASNHRNNNAYDSSHYDNYFHDNEYANNIYKDRTYRDHVGSDEVNVLRVPSSRAPQYASPDPGWNSDDSTGEITAAELMAPQDFDAVADDIIAKVKGEMRVTAPYEKYSRKDDRNVVNYDLKASNNSGYLQQRGSNRNVSQFSVEDKRTKQRQSPEMSSHVCPVCKRLMVPPSHSAMLMIPCGHSLCANCCRGLRYCHDCGECIESTMPNSTLQRVITEFHSRAGRNDSAGVTGGSVSQSRSYQEEYTNLETRCDVLGQESDTISHSIESLTRKLGREKQQIAGITAEEDTMQRQIAALQEKSQALRQHRLEYEKNCDRLQNETKQEKQRLVLVKDTLKSLHGEMEKVKLLAESDD